MTTPALPRVSDRVRDLHARMTLEEKLAQLVGFWIDHGGEVVAPMAGEMTAGAPTKLAEVTEHGIGHFTRVYGTRPVEPADRAAWLWEEQRRLVQETRLGIPALIHEECLTGLAAWQAAAYPTPLAWGASFDADLVEEMAAAIGESMRELGIHQGLAPVLDVIRDPRWGRVDECIAEDPYLVGVLGTSYVRGLQSAGVHATLKHFLGYSGSRAGRNHAPVSVGPRELADVYAVPFEMAVKDGGARSVMNAYVDIDGVPAASSPELLTGLLREQWGFDGVVVADYFAVAFLAVMHHVAADRAAAAALALAAGIDVELPSGDAYLQVADLVRSGALDEAYVDRAVLRVLSQKEELGLLDEDFSSEPPASIDLDGPRHRELARRLAEESVVLIANDGTLPLVPAARREDLRRACSPPRPKTRSAHSTGVAAPRVAVIGPNADRSSAMLGCYSFVNHVLAHHPGVADGIEIPTVLGGLRAELGDIEIVHAAGCAVEGEDRSGFAEAVAAASGADVAVVVLGDQAGLFGRGTVGEGNDAESLDLPGVQRELYDAVAATGTPVVLVLLTGRPYALDWALSGASRANAVLQAFFPGEEGGTAIARILSGAVNPSGRLPVSLPRSAGAQPYTYLQPVLGGPSAVTTTDPTPLRPFGFGLSYTRFVTEVVEADVAVPTSGTVRLAVRVTNAGDVAGTEVVQVYARQPVTSVVRPLEQLVAFARVELDAGASTLVDVTVPTARLAFSDRRLVRVVEPGPVELWAAGSAQARRVEAVAEGIEEQFDEAGPAAATDGSWRGPEPKPVTVELTGPVHEVGAEDPRIATALVG